MNLADLLREVGELSLSNGRLNSDIKGFINRAQRAIAERRNWTFMHDVIEVILPGGETSVEMPMTFKELAQENSPVSYALLDSTVPIPVRVMSRAEMNRMGVSLWNRYAGAPNSHYPIRAVFMEQNNAGGWTMNMIALYAPADDTTFTVSCYSYPDDLEKAGDRSAITDHGDLAEAIINRAKALAYSADDSNEDNAKKADGAMKLYEYHFKQALYADTRKHFAGRPLHM